MRTRWLEAETLAGSPLQIEHGFEHLTLVPYGRRVRIRLPFWGGGAIWIRPAYVTLLGPAARERRLAIRDVTSSVVLGLLALGLVVGMALWWAGRLGDRPLVRRQ